MGGLSKGLVAFLALWAAGMAGAETRAASVLGACGGTAPSSPTDVLSADADGDGLLTIVDAVRAAIARTNLRGGTVTRSPANRYGSGGVYHGVVLDDPFLNGHPEARLVVTHRLAAVPQGTLGVWYYAAIGRWVIFNEDRSPMADGESFNYACGVAVFAVTATGDFQASLGSLDGSAVPLATHGYTAAYNPSPLGVGFANPPRWYAFNEDYTVQVAGEKFFVADARGHGGEAVHDAANDYAGIGIILDDPRLNGNPRAILLAQHVYTRGANASPIGVWYDESRGRWVAYNETLAPLAMGEAVHYLVAPP
jgi:hypothetical protein